MTKERTEFYKRSINENLDMFTDGNETKTEKMCAFLRVMSTVNQMYKEEQKQWGKREEEIERALLWVIHEQCEYAGKCYTKLLIHGEEAFAALGIEDGCDAKEIEERLFK